MKQSKYCEVIQSERKVIKYPRQLGITQEYYRSTPETDILEKLISEGISVPKIIEKNSMYFIEEYIDGNLLDSLYSDYEKMNKQDIDSIIDNIIKLIGINCHNLNKYIAWNNVSEFFNLQINNTESIWEIYKNKYCSLYNLLNINDETILKLRKLADRINSNRPLCLIHGDRHKNNMIKKDKTLYFIDWELGCVGDLAYDIAFHIHQMKYNQKDLEYFLLNLNNRLPNEYKSILNDINSYLCFITARSVIYYVKILDECEYSDRLLDKFYIRLQKMCDYDELDINLTDKEIIKQFLINKKAKKLKR